MAPKEALVVVGLEIRAEEADHYNFEVADWHTYFVGETEEDSAVWVHNLGCSTRRSINRKRKRLEEAGFQEHHIISDKNPLTMNHPLLKKARFDLQSRGNKIHLPSKASLHPTRSIHLGRHSRIVNKRLAKYMDEVMEMGRKRGWKTHKPYRRWLKKLIAWERKNLKTGYRGLNKHRRPWAWDD